MRAWHTVSPSPRYVYHVIELPLQAPGAACSLLQSMTNCVIHLSVKSLCRLVTLRQATSFVYRRFEWSTIVLDSDFSSHLAQNVTRLILSLSTLTAAQHEDTITGGFGFQNFSLLRWTSVSVVQLATLV